MAEQNIKTKSYMFNNDKSLLKIVVAEVQLPSPQRGREWEDFLFSDIGLSEYKNTPLDKIIILSVQQRRSGWIESIKWHHGSTVNERLDPSATIWNNNSENVLTASAYNPQEDSVVVDVDVTLMILP